MSEPQSDLEVSSIHRKFTINGARIVKIYDNALLLGINPGMITILENFENKYKTTRSLILNKVKCLIKVKIDDKSISYNEKNVNISLKYFTEKEKVDIIIEAKKLYKTSESSVIYWRLFNVHKYYKDKNILDN